MARFTGDGAPRNASLLVLFCTFMLSTASAANISGIAISQYSGSDMVRQAAKKISWGWNSGKIYRFDVRSGKVSEPIVLWDQFTAHCPRISPSGSRVVFNTSTYEGDVRRPAPDPDCRGKILIINSDGSGEPRELVSDVNCLVWLDWPMEEYVYYQSDYEGSRLYRVNTMGTPKPELLSDNFRGTGKSDPDGARYWSVSADGSRVGGWFGGELQAGSIDLDGGGVTFKSLYGGCGGSISPDGTILTRNGGGHSTIYYHQFDRGQYDKNLNPLSNNNKNAPISIGDCRGNGTNWHRMHWPVNSSEWMLISMGNGYQIDKGCHPVLLKRDGSDCFAITPLENGQFYEGSDFWFGNPDQPVSVSSAPGYQADVAGISLRRNHHTIVVNAQGQIDVRLFTTSGRQVFRTQGGPRSAASVPLPRKAGVYVARIHTAGGVQSSSILVR
jgi:hypothetical protein